MKRQLKYNIIYLTGCLYWENVVTWCVRPKMEGLNNGMFSSGLTWTNK